MSGDTAAAARPRRGWRLLLAFVLLLAVAAGLVVVHTATAQPIRIDWAYDRLLIAWLRGHPQARIDIALPLWMRPLLPERSALDPYGPEAAAADTALLADGLRTLRDYDRDALDVAQRLDYDIIERVVATHVDDGAFALLPYSVNAFTGPAARLPEQLALDYPLDDLDDAQDWLLRTQAAAGVLLGVRRALDARRAAGLIPPQSTVDDVIAALKEQLAYAPIDHPLVRTFAARLEGIDRLNALDRLVWVRRLAAQLDAAVYPQWRALLAQHEVMRADATGNHGAWALNGGDAWYDHEVRLATTTGLDADSWHERALARIQDIDGALPALLDAAGIPAGPLGTRLKSLQAPLPEGPAPDLAALREWIEADRARLPDGLRELDLEIQAQPPWRAAYRGAVSWEPDTHRPPRAGITIAIDPVSAAGLGAGGLHEATLVALLPALLQTAAVGRESQPRLRRTLVFPAWVQGWTLVTARRLLALAPVGAGGDRARALQQQTELEALGRLVMDSGIHRRRWPRDRALSFAEATLGWTDARCAREVDRIIAVPGEAMAAGAGLLSFDLLEEAARTQLGTQLDEDQLARWIVEQGPMPLEIFERQFQQWLAVTAESSMPEPRAPETED